MQQILTTVLLMHVQMVVRVSIELKSTLVPVLMGLPVLCANWNPTVLLIMILVRITLYVLL